MTPQDILSFWFEEIEPARWWVKDAAFDQDIRERFLAVHTRATRCELFDWRTEPTGRLAELIVLDQFSRNIYRDTAAAFAHDSLALALAQEAVAQGIDQALPQRQRSFIYLPFMHSESVLIHRQAVALYTALGDATNLEFELKHQAIITQFGRYPHRNALLGRTSTAAELAFLRQPDSGF